MNRQEIAHELFSDTIPELWCPVITHFREARTVDVDRTHRHLDVLARNVRGLLIPGSTGEGWDMSDAEILELLGIVLRKTVDTNQILLVGILKTTTDEMLAAIEKTVSWLLETSGTKKWQDAFDKLGVRGFVVCPPRGSDRSQDEIYRDLSAVLQLGYPTALYQLPQVTENEMTASTVRQLWDAHENFFMLKDTSGGDKVALSGDVPSFNETDALGRQTGVFFVRGAEGDYARWPKTGGGVYDGLLLSTANSFPEELATILKFLSTGKTSDAKELSDRVAGAVTTVMENMASFGAANAFATTNKVLDHIRAWGSRSLEVDPPMVYSGARLPKDAIRLGVEALEKSGIRVEKGYLE